MNMKRYRGTLAAAVAAVIAAGMAGCGHKRTPESLSDSPAMSVDVESLWKKECCLDCDMLLTISEHSDGTLRSAGNSIGFSSPRPSVG